ncbi:MAG: transcriptional repressor [Anaerolineae bacterium]|jgi:Fur family ferric uptake transcriptional regulator|nr:transcriptional repressor [Anaerolineae bacterium]
MSPHLERLKAAGYKLTKARSTILHVIEAAGGHVTSAEVLEKVAALNPSIGRASVFRTLDLLTRLVIIRPTYPGGSTTPGYVLMPGGHHHHIICMVCNRIIEFDDCGLEGMAAALEERLHVRLEGHLLEFYGRCDRCRELPLPGSEA